MRTVAFEYQRNGNHHCGQAADQGAGPLDSKILEHLFGEKRKPGSETRSQNNIGRHGGCSPVGSVSED